MKFINNDPMSMKKMAKKLAFLLKLKRMSLQRKNKHKSKNPKSRISPKRDNFSMEMHIDPK